MDWLKKIFQSKHQRHSEDNTFEHIINDLIDFLTLQISTPLKAKGLLNDAMNLRKCNEKRKIANLPSFYLSFEQFLTEIDTVKSFSVESLRHNVRKEFPQLLELESFNLIFKTEEKQGIILCKMFLVELLITVIDIFGSAQNDWFSKTKNWLQDIPNQSLTKDLPFEFNHEINNHNDWIFFLKTISKYISQNIEEKVGDELTRTIFERSYAKLAKSYKYLDSFPMIVSIIPERFLNAEKITILSKHQISKLLLDKADYLEELNKELADKNHSLELTQKALQKSNHQIETTLRQLSTVMNTVNEGIITANTKGEIIIVNRAVQEIFGYEENELLGESLTKIMPPKYHESHTKGMENHVRTGISHVLNKTVQLEGQHKNGRIFPIEINISKGLIDGQTIFTAALKDITQRVEMEKELLRVNERLEEKVKERTFQLTTTQEELKVLVNDLERSNKDLEDFAYVVSHDLQEPLRTISSYLQLLKKRYPESLDEIATEFLNFAVDGSFRMKKLISDLLEFSRTGRGGANYETIKLSELSDLYNNLFSVTLKHTGGQLIFKGCETVEADMMLLTQLLQNLIGNSLKFQKPDTHPIIIIEIKEDEKEWLFSVKDNGIGIDEKFHERVFAVFQRLHIRTEFEGTGIGLAICKKIVDVHKGKIWIESEFGAGTTFFFTIPYVVK